MLSLRQVRFVLKPIVFAVCLLPAVWVMAAAFGIGGDLGANPVEAMLDHFGNWAIRFIMIALAVTPLRQITGLNWIARFRRMLGLFAFFYVFMHFLTWLTLVAGMTPTEDLSFLRQDSTICLASSSESLSSFTFLPMSCFVHFPSIKRE